MWERVYTVTDYCDGPRQGVADFQGRPHFYESWYDHETDEWAGEWRGESFLDYFLLTPIDSETLALANEEWQIWLRWEAAFHRGEVDLTSHPALPADRERHETLKPILEERLKTDRTVAVCKVGDMRRDPSATPDGISSTLLEVLWSEPQRSAWSPPPQEGGTGP